MALFNEVNISLPCFTALLDPMNKAPTEHMDNSNSVLRDEGRNVAACTNGNTGLNLAKYNLVHRFYSLSVL